MKTLLLYWNEFIDHSPKYLKERISSDKIFDRDIGELMELWSKGEKAVKKQLKEEGVKQFPRDDAWDFLEFMSIRFNWKDLIAKEDTPRVENHRTFPSTVSDKTPEKEGEILRDILFKKVKECLRNADKLAMNILKYIIIFYFILNLSPSSPAEQKTTISEFVIPACSNNTQGLVSRCDPDNRCYTKYQLKPGDQCIDDSDCPVGTQCSQVNDNMLCVAPQQKNKPLPKCYYLDVEMYIDQDKVEEKYIYNPTNEERGCLFDSEINKSDKYLYHQRGTRRCYHKDEKDKYVKAKVGQCDNKGKMIR